MDCLYGMVVVEGCCREVLYGNDFLVFTHNSRGAQRVGICPVVYFENDSTAKLGTDGTEPTMLAWCSETARLTIKAMNEFVSLFFSPVTCVCKLCQEQSSFPCRRRSQLVVEYFS